MDDDWWDYAAASRWVQWHFGFLARKLADENIEKDGRRWSWRLQHLTKHLPQKATESGWTMSLRLRKHLQCSPIRYSQGHSAAVRIGWLIEVIEALDSVGEVAAFKLVDKSAQNCRPYEVSRYCRTSIDFFCIILSHFRTETADNNQCHRPHQNKNTVWNCAEHGLPPCHDSMGDGVWYKCNGTIATIWRQNPQAYEIQTSRLYGFSSMGRTPWWWGNSWPNLGFG